MLIPPPAPTAGGIIVLLVDQLTVGPTGAVSSSAIDSARDVAASGGMVLARGRSLTVGTNRITALGATATAGTGIGPFVGVTLAASPGYVVLDAATVVGTTAPPAGSP